MWLISNWKLLAGAGLTLFIGLMMHDLRIDELEKIWSQKQKEAVQGQADKCDSSKKPAKEANDQTQTNNDALLAQCIAELQQPGKCIPVYVSRPSSGSAATCEQSASGLSSSQIEAKRIESQHDRDNLNAAKIWAQGYLKYINQQGK